MRSYPMQQMIKYTIVIPTYNEEKDIEETIHTLQRLNYPSYNVIFVDDSKDNTPKIIRQYENETFKLIIPETRKGRSEARNIGIKAANCDVVIILNADVHLPENFLEQISVYYHQGYDCVSVHNEIKNTEQIYSRFLELRNLDRIYSGVYQKRKETIKYFWTEGFSVRKDILMKTSLFPSDYIVPIVAGEDVRLIDELREHNCNGVYDESIVVPHIAPSTFKEFWYIRVGRGEGTPQIRRFVDKWSYPKITLWALAKLAKRLLTIILIIPLLWESYKLARHSFKNKFIETFGISYVFALEQIALSYGEFKSLLNVYRKEKATV